jgi:hypothetical protein
MDKKFIGPLIFALVERQRAKRKQTLPAEPRSRMGMMGRRGTADANREQALRSAKEVVERGSLEPSTGKVRMIKADFARLSKGMRICLVSFLGQESLEGYRGHLRNELKYTAPSLDMKGEIDLPGALLPKNVNLIIMDTEEWRIPQIMEFARGAKQAGIKVILASNAGSRNIQHDRLYNANDDPDFAKLDLMVIGLLREIAAEQKAAARKAK